MTTTPPTTDPYDRLGPFDAESGDLNAVIDTPRGSRNKYKLDQRRGLFRMAKVLTAGAVFPFDFGFVPGTLGDDGDPLDVLVLMDEGAFVGCLVPARLVGVIEAEQAQGKEAPIRNDRLVAVASSSHQYGHVRELRQIDERLLAEIEHFFVSYNAAQGRRFEPRGRRGARTATRLVDEGVGRLRAERRVGRGRARA